MRTGDQFVWLLERYRASSPFPRDAYLQIPGAPTQDEADAQIELMLRVGVIRPHGDGLRVSEKGQTVLEAIKEKRQRETIGPYWVGG